MEKSIFEAAGGRPAIVALAQAWHRRCLEDDVVAHAFSHGFHPHHVDRLAAYWAEALGGPPGYSDDLGDHSQVLRMHAGNGVHEEMDERAVACFVAALDDVDLPDDPRLRPTLQDWFTSATAEMATHPDSADTVPAGLPFPHWTWDGPAREATG